MMTSFEDHCDTIFGTDGEASELSETELGLAVVGACADAVLDWMMDAHRYLMVELDTSLCGCSEHPEAREVYAKTHEKVAAFLAGGGAHAVYSASLLGDIELAALAARAAYGASFSLDHLGLSLPARLRLLSRDRQGSYLELALRFVANPRIAGTQLAA